MNHEQKLKQALQELDALKGKIECLMIPELVVGKWYMFSGHRTTYQPLMFINNVDQNRVSFKGFDYRGIWTDKDSYPLDELNRYGYREATSEEIESALIKEANRRYKVGDKVRRLDGYYYGFTDDILYEVFNQFEGNRLIGMSSNGYYHCLFKDGEWAEIIKQDKFSELKEAHKNGAEIQFYHEKRNKWYNSGVPMWNPDCEYRINPKISSINIDQDIQKLRSKYPQYRFTIHVEDNI